MIEEMLNTFLMNKKKNNYIIKCKKKPFPFGKRFFYLNPISIVPLSVVIRKMFHNNKKF